MGGPSATRPLVTSIILSQVSKLFRLFRSAATKFSGDSVDGVFSLTLLSRLV